MRRISSSPGALNRMASSPPTVPRRNLPPQHPHRRAGTQDNLLSEAFGIFRQSAGCALAVGLAIALVANVPTFVNYLSTLPPGCLSSALASAALGPSAVSPAACAVPSPPPLAPSAPPAAEYLQKSTFFYTEEDNATAANAGAGAADETSELIAWQTMGGGASDPVGTLGCIALLIVLSIAGWTSSSSSADERSPGSARRLRIQPQRS